VVRILAFHARYRGSSPLRVTKSREQKMTNATIEIDMTDESQTAVLSIFKSQLCSASIEVFDEFYTDEDAIYEAMGRAAFNQVLVDAITSAMHEEFELEDLVNSTAGD
jgi:hypothetical protein